MAGSAYLVGYNALLCLAWGYVLYLALDVKLLQHGSTPDVYKAVELPLKVAQSAALLEVVHSAVGIVRSPLAITAMQVASRIWCLWGIVVPVQGPCLTGSLVLAKLGGMTLQIDFFSLMLAWGLSEVIRYSFFALKEVGSVPYVSLWLRYSGFIVLYPIGVASELTMCWLALPTIKASGMFSLPLPNAVNFGFDYYWACIVICVVYLPGLPQLYGYLLKQRKKMLAPPTKAKAA